MKKECEICNSIIWEVTLFNGETRSFCSISCVNTDNIIEEFRELVQSFIDRYQYIHEEQLVYFKGNKSFSKYLIKEMVKRSYFYRDRNGFIYPIGAIIKLPRAV